MKPRAPTMVQVKPTGSLPVPLPRSMRKPGQMVIPIGGKLVALTRFIQRRLDAGDLVKVDDAPPPATKAVNDPAPAAAAATPPAAPVKGS